MSSSDSMLDGTTMPAHSCPKCRQPAPRWLPETSKDATVNYYRCDECAHVWNIPKNDPDAIPKVITETTRMRVPG